MSRITKRQERLSDGKVNEKKETKNIIDKAKHAEMNLCTHNLRYGKL